MGVGPVIQLAALRGAEAIPARHVVAVLIHPSRRQVARLLVRRAIDKVISLPGRSAGSESKPQAGWIRRKAGHVPPDIVSRSARYMAKGSRRGADSEGVVGARRADGSTIKHPV